MSLKSKVRSICQNYINIKVPFKYQRVIKKLSSNKDIAVLKQDKGRGVVIMDRLKYIEKCHNILDSQQFEVLDQDPTASTERSVQRFLRSLKPKLDGNTYKALYPTASNPGRFYGTAKVHKLKSHEGVEELTLRPIISNIGTATYHLAKYLARMLLPLTKSEYTIESTKDFIKDLRKEKLPTDYNITSFDVTSLFTNVPLDKTIKIILRKIFDEEQISTQLTPTEMEKCLFLCTKNVHFLFNERFYKQTDGVAMGSPLGPVLANIFMVELEHQTVPKLIPSLINWKRYVDDTFAYVKKGENEKVLRQLNSFDRKIQFTYEEAENDTLPFLDTIVKWNSVCFETSVYRKNTHTDLYIHWDSNAPKTWKRSTLRGLVRRAFDICSNENLLQKELSHLRKVFHEINGYPSWTIKNIISRVRKEQRQTQQHNQQQELQVQQQTPTTTSTSESDQTKYVMLTLPYKGTKGEQHIKKLRHLVEEALPANVKPRFTYKSQKLASRFNIKDPMPLTHKSDLVYMAVCPEVTCKDSYIGETGRRVEERIKDHGSRDKKSAILKHSLETGHPSVCEEHFRILDNGFSHYKKRKISEALFIKNNEPSLNEQGQSMPLCLLN